MIYMKLTSFANSPEYLKCMRNSKSGTTVPMQARVRVVNMQDVILGALVQSGFLNINLVSLNLWFVFAGM